MATGIYRVTGKSSELFGASGANIIELQFASDADAVQFGANLQQIFDGTIVSIDSELSTDYTLPYSAGTTQMVRVAATNGLGTWQNFAVMDLKSPWVEATRAAALIAAGYQMWNQRTGAFVVPSVLNCTVFTPSKSV